MSTDRSVPEALPHGEISEPFPNIFFVTGSASVALRIPIRFSRNMTIIRQGEELTLVNSVRLNEAGLKKIDNLGTIKHVIRLAGFHGMDDPFYRTRYGAKIWSVNAPYIAGSDRSVEPYLVPDQVIDESSTLPITNARLVEFKSTSPGEGLLLIEQEGGIVVSGDCLQNWSKPDRYFNIPARIIMRLSGFIKPHNIGPGWLKSAKPEVEEIKSLLNLKFNHVLPAHGTPVIGNAKSLYTQTISAL